jgi:hypothetical protein
MTSRVPLGIRDLPPDLITDFSPPEIGPQEGSL